MKGFKQLLAEANAAVETIPVQQALELANDPTVQFVDVREQVELNANGTIPGAVHAPRGLLEFIADPESPAHKKPLSSGKRLVLVCASGGRWRWRSRTLSWTGWRSATATVRRRWRQCRCRWRPASCWACSAPPAAA